MNVNSILQMSKKQEMKNIFEQVKNCKKCELHKSRENPVAGEGLIDTDILFIGEAPGSNEDKQGLPFVGKAGKLLDDLLESINLDRKASLL